MKKILLGVAGTLCAVALIFSIGAPAQASTLTSAQVQAIVGLLQSFGADASVVANVQATLTGQSGVSPSNTYTTPPATGSRICPRIDRTLSQGTSGSDVSDLQEYLGVSQTGYFGPMTAQAVSSFQSDEGLDQVGMVGPQTRAAFARRCGGGGGDHSSTFSVSPTSGTAPLSVNFSATSPSGTSYTIDFGDGSSGTLNTYELPCYYGSSSCHAGGNAPHTYTAAGTYVAKLIYQQSFSCPPGAMCPAMMPAPQVVGAVTITVDSGTTSGGVPSINGLDSPTSLSVGQTGTWTVHASAPSGTQLHYSVVWGDEGWGTAAGSAQQAQANIQTSATFSHTYQNAGTYNPTFTVANDNGSAQTSASVVVSGNTQAVTFSASPTFGTAPLAVYFEAANVDNGSAYYINYGDGTDGAMTINPSALGVCYFGSTGCTLSSSASARHSYSQAGTYSATLSVAAGCTQGGMGCPAYLKQIGTVTITVSGGTVNASFSASPTSGIAPLDVQLSATNLNSDTSQYSVDFGDGTSGSGSCSSSPGLGACMANALFFKHTYTQAGTYTAKLMYQPPYNCPSGTYCTMMMPIPQVVGTVTITVMTGWL